MIRQQSVSTYELAFLLTDTAGDAVTGATPTVTVRKNAGAYGAASSTVTEVANGLYTLSGSGLATDLNTLGSTAFHVEAAGALDFDMLVEVVPYDPFAALAPTAAQNADQVRTELATELARIDADISSIPAATEAAMLNEGDASALLAAIAAKIELALVDEGDATATILAIATAVNTAIVAGTVGTNTAAIKAKTDNLPAQPAAVGSEMTLTAAYDTAKTAATQTSVNTLQTTANAIALDTGTTLPDQIAGISGGDGVTGANTLTVTVTDADTTDPIQSARVRVYRTGEDGTTWTNASGVAVMGRDSATWNVTVAAAGYETLATTLVVSGNAPVAYELTALIADTSEAPLCSVTINVKDQYGSPLPSEPVEIVFLRWGTDADVTPLVLSPPPTQDTDEDGQLIVDLLREAVYRITYGTAPYTRRIEATIPDAGNHTVNAAG